MNNQKITIIGAGNIAQAFIHGLAAAGYDVAQLHVSNRSGAKLEQLKQHYAAINVYADNKQAAAQANIIIFAVKPYQMALVLKEITPALKEPLLISFANGVTLQALKGLYQSERWLRAMPNINMQVAQGVTVLFNDQLKSEDHALATQLFAAVGTALWLKNENAFTDATAITGCGPAYWLHMLASMEEAASALNIGADIAHQAVKQTFIGVGDLLKTQKRTFKELYVSVCSPGGSTEQALKVLAKNELHKTFSKMMQAAIDKALEGSTQETKI